MFKCFGYPNNTIVPEAPSNCETIKTLFTHESKAIYIHIEGVGVNSDDSCRKLLHKFPPTQSAEIIPDVIYQYINYESKSILYDLISAVSDMKVIASVEGSSAASSSAPQYPIKFKKSDLLKKLENVIITNILKYKEHAIVLIGVSHGSILIHGALVKIKMIMNNEIQQALKNRVYVLTLGSPRYLPIKLLTSNGRKQVLPVPGAAPPPPNVLNFYNVKDPIVNFLRKYMKGKSYIKVPKIPKDLIIFKNNGRVLSVDPAKYCYEQARGLVFVDDMENYLEGYCYPTVAEKLVIMGNIPKYHAFPYNFFPVIDYFTLHNIMFGNIKTTNWGDGYNLIECHEKFIQPPPSVANGTQRGNGGVYISYLPEKKQYLVKKDKQGKYILQKKKKVYLKDIKGKYRYVK